MLADVRTVQALPAGEQQMLALFTVAHQPLNRSKMAELLAAAEIRDAKKRAISTSVLAELVTHWIAAGLMVELGERGYGRYRIHEELVHPMFAELEQRGELQRWATLLRKHEPLRSRYGFAHPETMERELLLALYRNEGPAVLDELCKLARGYYQKSAERALLVDALGSHAPANVIAGLGLARAEIYLSELFERAMLRLHPVGEGPLAFVQQVGTTIDSEPLALAVGYLALIGDTERALSLAQRDDGPSCAARCFCALTRARFDEARSEAARALEHTRTKSSKKLKGLRGLLCTWATLVLLTDERPEALALAREQLTAIKRPGPHQEVLHTGLLLLEVAVRNDKQAANHVAQHLAYPQRWDELLLWRVVAQVAQTELTQAFLAHAKEEAAIAHAHGFGWVAAELSALEEAHGLGTLYRSEEPWQRTLRALEAAIALADDGPGSAAKLSTERLVWTLTPESDGGYHVSARVQTAQAGGFRGGRQLSWKKLAEADASTPWLSVEDIPVRKHIRTPDRYEYAHQPDDALPLALVGHPRVFVDPECRTHVEVVRGAVRLEVLADDQTLRIVLSPRACHERQVACEQDGSGRVLLYTLTPAQRAIAEQLGTHGLVLPVEARDTAERVIARLVAHFPISSELGIDAEHLEEQEADARIHVGLARAQSGLRVRIFVAPIGSSPTFFPGEGSERVLGTVATGDQLSLRSVRAQRDLVDERRRLERLFEECPTLLREGGERRELRIDNLETCLELLSELRAATDVVLVWSEGEPLTLVSERALRDMRLTLTSAESWLSADGELEVDDFTKLKFHALLSAQRRSGRFVLLDDGRYLALSSELTKTLELLAPLAKLHEQKVELHPLALLHLAELDGTQLRSDDAVSARLARLREAATLEPKLPAGFEADLRPYQEEGYVWLSRLAHWGGGACLADDMGLGKTLQTLALLVDHAPRGPALVVAPTTVCENWLFEARRFAPTLRVSRLGAEREQTLRELGPYHVLVVSYGLLQQEIDALEKLHFQVVVLDEAQAIKNLTAQRTKAALRLQASVRVALTGTPVENHLGELYSLMRFLNPGLLGSAKQFETRFAKPIQRDADRTVAQQLKRLIRPFVLRRKKSEVLDDLPQKTVITLRIEPSAEERALYAALREQALAKVVAPGAAAQARIQILAELMRLRRAACHPRLVLPETTIESSKLNAFEELVDELRQGGHRALVFSQFVDQLSIVRKRLDELGISYQYLDGSSSPSARSASVDAFQSGQGDLFLISLKAGGFGLNLTAADYVVHLDPWWNPAVEDQASDRAHRIGQTRPVMVYRLVMQGSIEEKILALHDHKRDLADALLEGTASSAALTVDELLLLVREAGEEAAAIGARKRSDVPEALR
jgi:SNF2-related domain/Helicase conserved C-terminal domain